MERPHRALSLIKNMETKNIIRTASLTFLLALASGFASAQTDRQQDQSHWQDKLQQQAPRETERQNERAVRQSDATVRSHRNDAAQEEKIKREKERSTGKEATNPAENPPVTPTPRLSDPTSTPLKN